jgi:hypothetical protein
VDAAAGAPAASAPALCTASAARRHGIATINLLTLHLRLDPAVRKPK